METKKLSLVVDMFGCPNSCKHCWLSHMPNISMKDQDDEYIVNYFKPYFDEIAYYSWLREPDFCNHYRKRWLKDLQISVNTKPERFELASFYRLTRDPYYVEFLKEVNTKKVQLTFFGLEEMSDRYIGRKGAYQELLKATEILIDHGIAPRWQMFINEENKNEAILLLKQIKSLNLYERCHAFGTDFEFFVHAGSCDGENEKLYPIRINKDSIPEEIIPYYLNYDKNYTEQELCAMLKDDMGHVHYEQDSHIVLNISNKMDVYFNYTHMKNEWKIGNLKELSPNEMMNRILNGNVKALDLSKQITIAELIQKYGDQTSQKMFEKDDYLHYLLNRYASEQ